MMAADGFLRPRKGKSANTNRTQTGTTVTTAISNAESLCLQRPWFYPFVLPSGRTVPSDHDGELDGIHHTRWQMLEAAVQAKFDTNLTGLFALDLASHQGWFSIKLAQSGFKQIRGFDARAGHVADARLMATTLDVANVQFEQSDVHALTPEAAGIHDLVLCLGLIYHLENPVGALRVARSLCRGLCLIETQIAPGQNGWMDFGSHRYVRPIQGSFALIDETGDTHGPEASTLGICLVPSLDALLWLLHKVGFSRVDVLMPPADAYEQLAHHKRVMVAAHV